MDRSNHPNSSPQRFDVELEPKDLARIDALLPSHSTAATKATRATMVRLLIEAGLEALENNRVPLRLTALPRPRPAR